MKNAEHLFRVIDEIEAGLRLHNQKDYHSSGHCGTAHCIAGWLQHDHYLQCFGKEPDYMKVFEYDDEREYFNELQIVYSEPEEEFIRSQTSYSIDDIWWFGVGYLDISDSEADLLFRDYLNLKNIRKAAEILSNLTEKTRGSAILEFLSDDVIRLSYFLHPGDSRRHYEELTTDQLLARAKETGRLTLSM